MYILVQNQAGGNPYSHPSMQQETSRLEGSWYIDCLLSIFPYAEQDDNIVWIEE